MISGDFRHALRSLLRMPALSAVVVVSIALGIGVNTVVFSWIQARVLQPIPGSPDGARIQLIEAKTDAGLYNGSSWPEYLDLRAGLRSFKEVFAARMTPLYLGEPGSVERVSGLLVSDNYFAALKVTPALGRFLSAAEVAQPGGTPVTVISYRLWQSHFQGSAGALDRTLRVNGQQLTVVGVTPMEFQGTTVGLQFDAWLPATLAPSLSGGASALTDRSVRGFTVMGRLAEGATVARAQQDADAVMRQLATTYPATNTKVKAEVLSFSDSPRGPQRLLNRALFILQAIMIILLLSVCGNVANLLLARASAREREMAIRLTLGAKAWRVGRLILVENLVLAMIGAALGALLAVWGTKALMLVPMVSGLPLRFQTGIDGGSLVFALLLGLLSSLLFGLAPALHLSHVEPHLVARVGRGAGKSRLRQTLMALQVGLATVVLIIAGTFFRGFLETKTIDPGFRRDGVSLAMYDLSGRSVPSGFTRTLAANTVERIAALPSVKAVAIASSVPLDIHGLPSRVFTVEGYTRPDAGDDEALTNIVTPGYFSVMGIDIVAGRDFSAILDEAASKEVIVNQEFVRRFVQKGEPLGRWVQARGGPFSIVGVARDSLYNAFGEPPTPAIYFSYKDTPRSGGEIHVLSKGGDDASLYNDIRRTMRDLDPELPVFNLRSMGTQIDTNLIFRKIPAQMFSVLGPLLLVLAAIGIYAMVAYAVSLRTREVGVRLALGATPPLVVRQFVGESFKVALVGAVGGWIAALSLALRFWSSSASALVFALVPLVLLFVAALACWIPARRVTRVEAVMALRNE